MYRNISNQKPRASQWPHIWNKIQSLQTTHNQKNKECVFIYTLIFRLT